MTDSKLTLRVDGLSKLSKVEDLREKLVDHFNAPVDRQMLLFSGKQVRSFLLKADNMRISIIIEDHKIIDVITATVFM